MRWLAALEEGAPEAEFPTSPLFSFREALEGEERRVTPVQRAENIGSVAAACEAVGAELILATLPPGAVGITKRDLCEVHPVCTELVRVGNSVGSQFFDLTPGLRGASDDEVLMYSDPGHFTAVGNDRMMRFFAPSVAGVVTGE